MFKIDNVNLIFEEQALRSIAVLAIMRQTGARALRAIIEGIMTDIMYEIPSKKNIKTCTITQEVIDNKASPKYTYYKKTA